MGIIYKITNLTNGKEYIGKKQNLNYFERYYGGGMAIKLAIQKYGLLNFKKEIIDKVPNEFLCEKEKYWIKKLNTMFPKGYNLTEGGDGRKGPFSKETIEKMSKSRIGKKRAKEIFVKIWDTRRRNGNVFNSEETRKKISIGNKGKKVPLEYISVLKIRMKGEGNHFFGKKHSEEAKEKIGLSRRGKTYEQIYGIEKAKELKERRRIQRLGKKHSNYSKIKMSKNRKGKGVGNKNRLGGNKYLSIYE